MEKPTREQLETWIKKENWFPVNETATANGKQITYLTPSGQDVVIVYDLEGNLFGIGHVVQIPSQMQGPGLLGFGRPPIIGRG